MRKIAFFILVLCCGWIYFDTSSVSLALDEGGCLTCHQYPGLVRHKPNDGFKVLHIDEAKYASSPHGKVDCRKCHTTVVKVPHTDETRVDCTTTCHLDPKEREMVKRYPLNSFHKTEQSFITRLEDETACHVCHHLYPHSENKLVRALLNMHTGFMLCDVCHLKKDSFPDTVYDWKDTENADFSGQPFGTFYNPHAATAKNSLHFLSRIAVFVKENRTKQLTFDPQDTHKARRFKLLEDSLTAEQKAEQIEYFHRNTAKKQISVACDECHSSHSILDFRQLGFDDITTSHLTSLNIKGLVTKYKTFYFPELFGK
jgi:hypothetical protein